MVGDLDQRQARVLFMIAAEAAVVRAAPLYWSVICERHFRRLDKNFAAAAIVLQIISNQDSLATMLGTALEHENLAILEHRFAFDLLITGGADGYDYIVEEIRTCLLRHMRSRFDGSSGTRSYYAPGSAMRIVFSTLSEVSHLFGRFFAPIYACYQRHAAYDCSQTH